METTEYTLSSGESRFLTALRAAQDAITVALQEEAAEGATHKLSDVRGFGNILLIAHVVQARAKAVGATEIDIRELPPMFRDTVAGWLRHNGFTITGNLQDAAQNAGKVLADYASDELLAELARRLG